MGGWSVYTTWYIHPFALERKSKLENRQKTHFYGTSRQKTRPVSLNIKKSERFVNHKKLLGLIEFIQSYIHRSYVHIIYITPSTCFERGTDWN